MAPIHPRLISNGSRSREAIVARELALARTLSGNEKTLRDRAVPKLRKWLQLRSQSAQDFTKHDFLRLWKGLFYCVWMSDKPLVQEELCENISALFECFGDHNISTSILFYDCFLKTLAADWFGIDQHRIDKFLMLVRRVTRGILRCLKNVEWSVEATDSLESSLSGEGGLLCPTPSEESRLALGLQLHLVDCWTEEVSKVGDGNISAEAVIRVMKPFAVYLCSGRESRLASAIMKNIFVHLISQTDIGIEYEMKTRAWFQAGFPGGNVDAMSKVEVSDDEEENFEEVIGENQTNSRRALDPRAGHVDVELAQLPVDGKNFAKMLRDILADSQINKTNRTRMQDLIKSFETLDDGNYPYKLKNLKLPNDPSLKMPKAKKAAIDLIEFEKNVQDENEDELLKGLNKRQKRRILSKQRKKRLRMNDSNISSPVIKKHNDNASRVIKRKNGEKLKLMMNPDFAAENKKAVKNLKGKINKDDGDKTKSKKTLKNGKKNTDKEICPFVSTENILKNNGTVENGDDIVKNTKSFTKIDKKTIKKKKIKKTGMSMKNIESTFKILNVKNKEKPETFIPVSKVAKKLNDKNLKTPLKKENLVKSPMSSSKKVNIALSKNTSQTVIDYFKSVRQSPSIPFDGKKQPVKTSLKPNAMPSPVNPFYKKKMKINFI